MGGGGVDVSVCGDKLPRVGERAAECAAAVRTDGAGGVAVCGGVWAFVVVRGCVAGGGAGLPSAVLSCLGVLLVAVLMCVVPCGGGLGCEVELPCGGGRAWPAKASRSSLS